MSLKPKSVDFMAMWTVLRETLHGVITFSTVPRNVYSLCVAYPEPLADRLYQETKLFLDDHVTSVRNAMKKTSEQNLLSAYYKEWEKFSKGTEYLHSLYSYLNNQHIRKQKMSDAELTYGSLSIEHSEQMKEIGELCLDTWKRLMIEPLKTDLIRLLLGAIRYDRLGTEAGSGCQYQTDTVIKGVIHSFVEVEDYKKKGNLDLYEDIFEQPFLAATGDYYREEAARLLQSGTVSQYMERVIARIEAEELRAKKFLWRSSHTKVKAECENRMVADHVHVLHGECKTMVAQEAMSDLEHMFRLLKPIQGAVNVLLDEVQAHIKSRGLEAISGIQGESMATDFVENVLDVYKKYRMLIEGVFQKDLTFMGAMDKAMTAVINHRQPKTPAKSPELLARYCDSLLKKSQKGISESEIDNKLENSITVFKYLDDKDIFQKFYSRNLGKRLIHQQSHSMDLEEGMINRLKQACGYEFTNKFHRMFTDISLAEDLNSKFTASLQHSKTDVGINYFVRVLQQGAWPLSQHQISPLSIPQELEKTIHMYEKFYAKQFSGRKLTWLFNLSSGDLKLGYLNKSYIVNMTTFQMAILLLFEKSDSLTYEELEEMTKIESKQFPKFLQSLIDSKLLLHVPASNEAKASNSDAPELDSSSVISLNFKYSNKRTKFRIANAVQKETPAEVEQTHQAVDEDRKMFLQAAIVRVMKARKVLKHNLLVQEVLSQSIPRFAPPVPLIKKCIESLIDKAYIERSKDSPDEYAYMA